MRVKKKEKKNVGFKQLDNLSKVSRRDGTHLQVSSTYLYPRPFPSSCGADTFLESPSVLEFRTSSTSTQAAKLHEALNLGCNALWSYLDILNHFIFEFLFCM